MLYLPFKGSVSLLGGIVKILDLQPFCGGDEMFSKILLGLISAIIRLIVSPLCGLSGRPEGVGLLFVSLTALMAPPLIGLMAPLGGCDFGS